MNAEFLKLLQMTEAGRKCEGRECIGIEDADVVRAKVIDALEESHKEGALADGHGRIACEEGAEVVRQRAVPPEGLHSRGVDLPEAVFQPT